MSKNLKLLLEIDAKNGASATIRTLEGDVNKVETATQKVTKSTNDYTSAMGSLKKAGAAAIAAISIGKISSEVLSATKEMQSLQASLVTVTGSATAADQAFSKIQSFAQTTPYQLAEVTNAFIKMEALGLTASERAMRSYGDTASSMGKGLEQMIEAVADATTGEFERLREFGIKTSVEGDKVRFTFRGMTTEIGNSAAEIESYLMRLGETNFAGGMARQMETVGGKIANLEDTWSKAFNAIGESSVGGGIIDTTISVLDKLGDSVYRVFTATEKLQELSQKRDAALWEKTDLDLVNEYNNEIRSSQTEVQTLQAAIEQLKPYMGESTYAADAVAQYEQQIASLTERIEELNGKVYGLDPADEIGAVEKAMQSVYANAEKWQMAQGDLTEKLSGRLAVLGATESETRQKILSTMSSENQALQKKIWLLEDAKKATTATAKVVKQMQGDWRAMLDAQDGEFGDNPFATPAATGNWRDMIDAQTGDFDKDQQDSARQISTLESYYADKLEKEKTFRDRRLEMVQNALEMETISTEKAARLKADIEEKYRQTQISTVSEGLGTIANLMNTNNKRLFEIGKAGAIAKAIVDTYQMAVSAYKALVGIRVVGPALAVGAAAAATAYGMAQVAQIRSQSFSVVGQAHDGMTSIPKEGTWNLDGGERVIAPAQNKDLTAFLNANKTQVTNQAKDGNTYIFNIYAADATDLDRVIMERLPMISNAVRKGEAA